MSSSSNNFPPYQELWFLCLIALNERKIIERTITPPLNASTILLKHILKIHSIWSSMSLNETTSKYIIIERTYSRSVSPYSLNASNFQWNLIEWIHFLCWIIIERTLTAIHCIHYWAYAAFPPLLSSISSLSIQFPSSYQNLFLENTSAELSFEFIYRISVVCFSGSLEQNKNASWWKKNPTCSKCHEPYVRLKSGIYQ